MKKTLVFLLLLSIGTLCWGMDIVKDGEPAAVIVIGENVPYMVEFAAAEFQQYIEKISGAKLSIQKTRFSMEGISNIFIGESSYTENAGFSTEGLSWDGFKIISKGGDLYLFGRDYKGKEPIEGMIHPFQLIHGYNKNLKLNRHGETGTLFAVYRFLEDYCGVRWFMPGELGEVVPERKNIQIGEMNFQKSPDFEYRFLYHCLFNKSDDQTLWYRRAGYGAPYPVQIMHSFWMMNKYSKTNPEFFALIDGERDFNITCLGEGNLCLSNEGLLKQWVSDIKKYFDQNPEQYLYPVMPNDHYRRICDCAECQAQIDESMGPRGRFSNYVWGFINKVAKEIYKTHPDKLIGCCSYSGFALPPSNIELSPNIAVSITKCRANNWDNENQGHERRKIIEAWAERTKNVYTWEYYNWATMRPHLRDVPVLFSRYISEELKYLKGKSKGEFIEAMDKDWLMHPPALNHLNIYLTGKLLWDADLDVNELLEDYYAKFYGPAKEAMKSFWTLGEKTWTTDIKDRGIEIYYKLYTREVIDKLHSYLKKAIDETQEGSVYRKRVEFILSEFEPVVEKVRNYRIATKPSISCGNTVMGLEFDRETEKTGGVILGSGSIKDRELKGGALRGEISGKDPQILLRLTAPVDSAEVKYLKIGMKVKTEFERHAQFFLNIALPGRGGYIEFDIVGDGEFYEYVIPLYNSRNWDKVGDIENVRIDPASIGTEGDTFEIYYIRFMNKIE
ncbi:MAG: DUF4838 domain-containing protein [Candidatus Omnitrophica bacterium]|nr:DUF4838 domain-containing protein [Candidatus Omnitrophota bacterium]